jgi:hypothetical protein
MSACDNSVLGASQGLVCESIPLRDSRTASVMEAEIRVLRSVSELEEIRSVWESWPGHRDSDIDFFLTVVRSSPETIRPHVIVAYRDGHPDAILIGRIDKTTFPLRLAYWKLPAPRVRLLTFVIGAQRGNSSPEMSELLLNEALGSLQRGEADLARLEFVRLGSPLYRLAQILPGKLGRDHSAVSQPQWSMDLPQTYEDVLKALSHDLRKELRRTTKRIESDFRTVTVKCFERPDELETMLADIEDVAVRSYQRRIGVGFRSSEYMRQLLLFQAKRARLLGYVLYVEDKPRAFSLGCLYNGVFYSDDIGFDPDFSKYSPGTVLQARVLEDLCARGIKSIDFGPGDALYKARFATTRHEEASLYLYPSNSRGVALNSLRIVTIAATESSKKVASQVHILPWIKRKLRGKKSAGRGSQ